MSVTYYPINEGAARRAKEANSFSDYSEGSATASYRRQVDKAVKIAEYQKGRVDPEYHDKIDALLDSYARKLADNINQANAIDASVPSVMIAGASNFPVRKKEKQNQRRDANMTEYTRIQGILEKIQSVGMGGIMSDDENALAKLRAKLDALERHQAKMKAANAAVRMKDTEAGIAKLHELGYTDDEIRQLRTPDYSGRVGYPTWELSNNNANIHRIRERIATLEKEAQRAAENALKASVKFIPWQVVTISRDGKILE